MPGGWPAPIVLAGWFLIMLRFYISIIMLADIPVRPYYSALKHRGFLIPVFNIEFLFNEFL